MHRTSSPYRAIIPCLGTTLMLLLSTVAAQANPAEEIPTREKRSVEILDFLEEPRHASSRFTERLSLRKGKGIQYRHAMRVGERKYILSLAGPLVKKRTPGLSFEIRF